jgi:beta-mannosidase
LNDCWPCTSWAIVDFFLRPKLGWYAIARELRPIQFAISRKAKFTESLSLTESPRGGREDEEVLEKRDKDAHPTPSGYGGEAVTFDVWGVNAHLTTYDVPIKIEFFEISSGKRVSEEDVTIQLLPNQSTEVLVRIDISKYDPSNLVGSVVFTVPSGEILRSSADWPQPLKYLNFDERGVTMSTDGERVTLRVKKPTKGVLLDVEGDDDSGLEWSDNGFDIMPGETVNVIAKGLGGRKVAVCWYGQQS